MAETLQTFGRYSLLKRLARGGMAEIFEARVDGPAGFDKRVAVKRLHANLAEDQLFVSMLGDEARITARLSHPNICQVFDFGIEASTYFIAMELIEGCDLGNLSRRIRKLGLDLPLAAAVWIAREAAEGLAYAHALCDDAGRPFDVVHRDVSPQNILVSAHGEVKVCDFGIAKATARLANTQAGVLKGKFCYMAPEQARGEPLDGRADVFGLGIVLVELIAGAPLYPQTFSRETLDIVRRGAYPPLRTHCPDLPESVLHVLQRALAVSRVSRPGARELADMLGELLRAEHWDFDRSRLGQLVLTAMPELQREPAGDDAGLTQLWPGSGRLGPVTDQELGTDDLEIASGATVAATPANLEVPASQPSVRVHSAPHPVGWGDAPRAAAPREVPSGPPSRSAAGRRRSVLDPRRQEAASQSGPAMSYPDEPTLVPAPPMSTRMVADDVPAEPRAARGGAGQSGVLLVLGVLVAGAVVGVVVAVNAPLLFGGSAPVSPAVSAPVPTFVPLALPDAGALLLADAGPSPAGERTTGRRTKAGRVRPAGTVGAGVVSSPGTEPEERAPDVPPAAAAAGLPLTITALPSGVAYVDGRRIGRTPVKTRAAPGRHNVVVEGADGRRAQRTVTLSSTPESVVLNLE
jgi:serine/threonine protein kinase